MIPPSRRGVLAGLAALAAAPVAPAWAALGTPGAPPAFLAAGKLPSGAFALHGLTAEGDVAFAVPLPNRGHAAAAHPHRPEAVAFARRPGTFALVLDCASGDALGRLEAPEGRHFYGHGAFLAGGSLLATTENAVATGEGCLGIWDAADGYRRIGEVASGGIGPHEVIRLPGTDVLAVANGGIRTHPDTGREKLNLDTMRPNLAYVADGVAAEIVELDDPRLSIRHVAARPDGTVAIGLQSQHPDTFLSVPLLALHRRGAAPEVLGADLARRAEGYVGSVAWSGDGRRAALTAPRGGFAAILEDGEFTLLERPDICGAAPAGAGLAFTDGLGGVLGEGGARRHAIAWDNHLVPLAADAPGRQDARAGAGS